MRFSVVVPCYNAERTVGPCLESVARQTLRPEQVIVVDDGSTDGSVAAVAAAPLPVERLATSRAGAAAARNAGIRAARAPWIAFLDADDLWHAGHLARAAQLLGEGGAVGRINHYDRIPAAGGPLLRRPPRVGEVVRGRGLDEYVALFARIGHFVGMSACVVARERALAVGGLCEEQIRRHDIEFWLRVVADAPWVYDPEPTSIYRKGSPGGLSAAGAAAGLGGFRAFLRHGERAADKRAYDAVLAERARSAVARAFESGDAAAQRRACAEAFEWLAPRHRAVFGLVRRAPSLFPAFRAAGLA
jgi:glycosyltransferase involved in cell wall biosynthesis